MSHIPDCSIRIRIFQPTARHPTRKSTSFVFLTLILCITLISFYTDNHRSNQDMTISLHPEWIGFFDDIKFVSLPVRPSPHHFVPTHILTIISVRTIWSHFFLSNILIHKMRKLLLNSAPLLPSFLTLPSLFLYTYISHLTFMSVGEEPD